MKDLIRNIIILGLLAFLFFLFFPSADRNNKGEITSKGSLSTDDLRIGDCFNQKELSEDPDTYTEVNEVEAMPCSSDHDFKVYAITQNAFSDQKSFDSDSLAAANFCLSEYSKLRDISIDEVYIKLFEEEEEIAKSIYFFPTSESWAKGDRKVSCAIYE